MTRINTRCEYFCSNHRKNKIAVFGTPSIDKCTSIRLADSLLKEIKKDTKVFTLKSDYLGRIVRQKCKDLGIRTYQYTVKKSEGDYTQDNMEELAVARLAWHVEKFYCIWSESDKKSFARYAIEISCRMMYQLKAVQLKLNRNN